MRTCISSSTLSLTTIYALIKSWFVPEREAVEIMFLDAKWKNIVPPPSNGSKYLLNLDGINESDVDNSRPFPPVHFTKGRTCRKSTPSIVILLNSSGPETVFLVQVEVNSENEN